MGAKLTPEFLTQLDNSRKWATENQTNTIDALLKTGSYSGAAKLLNKDESSCRKSIQVVLINAAKMGYAPEADLIHPTSDPFYVKGVSTFYNEKGQAVRQWVKTDLDKEKQKEILAEAYTAMATELPKLAPVKFNSAVSNDLCNLVVFTDYHMGQMSWGKEGGSDWDLKIAERVINQSFDNLIERAPKSGTLLLCIQGDFLHTDGLLPVTPAHKHVLDVDSRFSKMVDVSIRAIRRILDKGLRTHAKVHLVIAEGNHDETASLWLRKMFKALYENEPRLSVNDSELPYYVYKHGQVMLGFHHGHKVSNETLPLLFASQYPSIWGATAKRYVHCGHRHHTDEKEYSGVTVTQHPTLAARDAHSSRGGYISERAANLITYHTKYGQVGRTIVCPEMFE